MSTEICPYCGGTYKRLNVHLLYCKEKPVEDNDELDYLEEEIDYYTDYTDIDYTVSTSEEVLEYIDDPTPETPCPYLFIIAGNACSNCRGASCMASKDKKISNVDYCKTEWLDCLIYHEGILNSVAPVCPYFGLPPPGKTACRGIWCYAKDYGIGGVIKSVKRCKQWKYCGRYLEAKQAGVPYHRSRI